MAATWCEECEEFEPEDVGCDDCGALLILPPRDERDQCACVGPWYCLECLEDR